MASFVSSYILLRYASLGFFAARSIGLERSCVCLPREMANQMERFEEDGIFAHARTNNMLLSPYILDHFDRYLLTQSFTFITR